MVFERVCVGIQPGGTTVCCIESSCFAPARALDETISDTTREYCLPQPPCFCFRAGRRLWPCVPRADTVTLLIYSQQSHREIVSFATFQWLATSKLRMKYRDIGNQEQREEGSEVSHQHASQSSSLICGVFLSWSR